MPFIVNQVYVDIHNKNDLSYAKYLLKKKRLIKKRLKFMSMALILRK